MRFLIPKLVINWSVDLIDPRWDSLCLMMSLQCLFKKTVKIPMTKFGRRDQVKIILLTIGFWYSPFEIKKIPITQGFSMFRKLDVAW